MKLAEIKAAVEAGKTVNWCNTGYVVVKDRIGQWLVWFKPTDHYIGLTWTDEVTVNGEPYEFFVADGKTDKQIAAIERRIAKRRKW